MMFETFAILNERSKIKSITLPKEPFPVAKRRLRAIALHIQPLIKRMPHTPVNHESDKCGNFCSIYVPMKSQGEPIKAKNPRSFVDIT